MAQKSKSFSDLITFTRGSTGTSFRPVSYGPEVLTNGLTGSSINTGASIVSGTLNMINVASGYASFLDSVSIDINTTYVFNITYNVTQNCQVLVEGVGIGAAISGSGALCVVYTTTSTLPLRRVQVNNSSASPVSGTVSISIKKVIFDRVGDPIQLFEHPANMPRINYDPSTLECRGVLIEEQRTNILNSPILTGSAGATVTQDGTKLLGIVANKCNSTGTSGAMVIPSISTGYTTGNIYTRSFLAKKGTSDQLHVERADNSNSVFGSIQYNLTTGVVIPSNGITGTMTSMGNDIWYCTATYTTLTNGGLGVFYIDGYGTGGVNKYLYIAAVQQEAGAFATSYIPVVNTSVTRQADIAILDKLYNNWNSSAGTIYVEFTSAETVFAQPKMVIYNTNGNEYATIRSATQMGTWDSTNEINSTSVGTNYKVKARYAVAFDSTSKLVCLNGVAPTTGASNYTLLGIPSFSLGSTTAGSQGINGHIRNIRYYPRKLSSAELQALTT